MSLPLCLSMSLVLFGIVHARTYEGLTTTCQESKPASERLTVSSVVACKAQCDKLASCIGVDTDGATCYTKSACEGVVGECQGWCGYRTTTIAIDLVSFWLDFDSIVHRFGFKINLILTPPSP